jgi:membrane-associated protein
MVKIPYTIRAYWDAVIVPLCSLLVFLSLYFGWQLLHLPPEDQLIPLIEKHFDAYGLPIIFASAIVEGLLLAGWYYPGSLVIFLGVIFSGSNHMRVISTIFTVICGLFIAYMLNYGIGRYGWYQVLLKLGIEKSLRDAQERLAKYGLQAIFLTYFHPNLAALTATAAGILDIPLRRFLLYSLLATILWNSFWGLVVFVFGRASLALMGLPFVLFVFCCWILYGVSHVYRRNRITTEVT